MSIPVDCNKFYMYTVFPRHTQIPYNENGTPKCSNKPQKGQKREKRKTENMEKLKHDILKS